MVTYLDIKNKCPVCGCEYHENVSVSDMTGDARLHMFNVSMNYLCVCLDCGCVYLPADDLTRLNDKLKRCRKK